MDKAAKRFKTIVAIPTALLFMAALVLLMRTAGTIRIPILMYHHLTEEGDGVDAISIDLFEEQMKALSENGYTAISFTELERYVGGTAELPEKPVIITFDDGYLSNYQTAYPILRKYGLKATMFVIGSMVGATSYKNTGIWAYPCFTYEQAKEMRDSGYIDIQSHTYDMHQWPPNETGDFIRESVLKLDIETEENYLKALENDFSMSKALIEAYVGNRVFVLSYPHGDYSAESEEISTKLGFSITVTTDHGSNRVRQGDPSCLRVMNRYAITDNVSTDKLLELLSRFW